MKRMTTGLAIGLAAGLLAGTAGAAAPTNYLHYWHPSRATNSVDYGPGGKNGTISGSVTVGTNGWFFNPSVGGIAYVSLPGPITNTTNYSFSFWAKPNKTAMDAQTYGGWVINDRAANGGKDDFQFLYGKASGKWGLTYWNTGGTSIGYEGSTAVHDVWTHVAVTVTGNQVVIYADGVAVTNVAGHGTPNDAYTGNAMIGNASWGAFADAQYRGYLDNLKVYQRVLSAAEVGSLYEAGRLYALPVPDLPIVANGLATNILAASADLSGTLITNGTSAATVTLYCATNDCTTNAVAWTNASAIVTNFGPYSTGAAFTNTVTGLASNTWYWWNHMAVNASGTTWAATAGSPSFKTLGPPVVNNGGGAAPVGIWTAVLNGNLTDGSPAQVFISLWADGSGTTNVLDLGWRGSGGFSTNRTGLTPSTPYSYRAWATNAYGTAWAPAASNFTTLAVGAAAYSWTNNANGNWTDAFNWNPNTGYPDAAGASAILDAPTAGLTATRTVTLTGTRTVGVLLLDSEFPANDNTFNVSGGKLVMDSGGSQPAVIMFGTNSHAYNTVSTPIEMASDLHLAMQSQYGNGYMTLSGGIASPDGTARTLSYRQWREGGQNGGYITISGPITGGSATHPLTVSADGNPAYTGLNTSDRPLFLNGANTFTGGIEVVRGGLSVASSFGADGNSVIFSNGTWLWAGSFMAPSNTTFTLASNAMVQVASGTFDIPGPLTVPAGGTLTKTGNGTLKVSGNNAATFATNAAITYSGILEIGHSNALGSRRAFTLSNYALLAQTAAADPNYTYNVQAYGGISGNSTFFDSLTFGIAGGGNMDIAENAIVFGDASALTAMNTTLKAAGRGREFYQLAGSIHTVRVDRVWKGVANLSYGAYTGYGTVYVLTIDTDCDFVLRSRGFSGGQSFGMNQLSINANGTPVVATFDGPFQLNNSPAAGYTNVTFRILNNVVHVWEGNAFGQNNKHAHVVVENGGSLRCGTHSGATPVAIGATLKVRAGGQVTLDPERAAALRILSGATLSGAGAIGPKETQMESGSTLSPGEDGVGTLAFTTKLQMKAGSACTWELGATTNDVANVSVANVTFDGAWTLRIRDAGGKPKPATPYVLLTYNTLTGFDPANVTIDYGTTRWANASVSDDAVNKRLVLTGLRPPTSGTVISIR